MQQRRHRRRGALPHDLDLASWRRVLDVDLTAPFRLSQALALHLREVGTGGAIVNVASINGVVAERGFADYNTAKGALIALTRSAAIDLAPDGIRVNAVCPGYIETEMSVEYLADDLTRRRIEEAIPLGRVGSAAEVARTIGFLLSTGRATSPARS